MQVATRFAVAVHLLSLLGMDENAALSSDGMAGSIGINAVVVRNIIALLKRAGLVRTQQGVTGTRLARSLAEMTLLDVYHAVDAVGNGALFALHPRPNPNCAVGANIQAALETAFQDAQQAMEARLAARTVADIVADLRSRGAASAETIIENQIGVIV